MALFTVISIGFISILTILFAYFKYSYGHWKSKGIPHEEPSIPYGNAKGLGKTVHLSHFTKKLYDKYKPTGAKMCGFYMFDSPVAMILDLDLVKKILVKDFANFNDRGLYYNEKDDPLSAHLFSLDGEKWKSLRAKLSPTFTSGKMKFMFPTIVKVAERFRDCLFNEVEKNAELEMKELCARYTTDVIGTCAFGIECNSLENPNAEFRHYGRKIGGQPRHNRLVSTLLQTFRGLSRALHIKKISDDVATFFMGVVLNTIDYREKNQVTRNDFMDILIKLKNQETTDNDTSITVNEIAAQAFVFFIAGFETSSTALTFCLYELALNREVQSKARQIIRQALKKHNGQLTYEMIMDIPYIDQILEETLRKYPILGHLVRRTKTDYKVPGMDVTIAKETSIFIPVFAIHYDPEFYPEPEKFDPDRFDSEAKMKRDSMTWLAFGDGPRNCIGLRFGMMQVRIGLVTLLNNFEVLLDKKTQIPPQFDVGAAITVPKDGVYLKLKPVIYENVCNKF